MSVCAKRIRANRCEPVRIKYRTRAMFHRVSPGAQFPRARRGRGVAASAQPGVHGDAAHLLRPAAATAETWWISWGVTLWL